MHSSRDLVKNGHYVKCYGHFLPKLWNKKLDTDADSENWSKVVRKFRKLMVSIFEMTFRESKFLLMVTRGHSLGVKMTENYLMILEVSTTGKMSEIFFSGEKQNVRKMSQPKNKNAFEILKI